MVECSIIVILQRSSFTIAVTAHSGDTYFQYNTMRQYNETLQLHSKGLNWMVVVALLMTIL